LYFIWAVIQAITRFLAVKKLRQCKWASLQE
jgi:hypothetical protein